MKTLKVFSIFAILFLTAVNFSFAQSANISDEQKAEMKAVSEEYIAKLNLTDEQKEQFQAINAKYAEKAFELKNSSGPKFSKMKKAKGIKADKDAEIKAMLTDEQFATYESFKDELAAKQKEILNKK